MIEAAMFIALGFAVAAALALMIAPFVYKQAVRTTRNRIEASVPLTLNEIQADKDQLRAEFAMSTRRLEMNLDKLKERASVQVIEVNRKRDELSKVAEEHRQKEAELAVAREEGRKLADDLKAREEKLAATEETLSTTMATLETRSDQLADYETALKAATADVDSHKKELAERDTKLTSLDEETKVEREQMRATAADSNRLRADLKAATASAEIESERAAKLEEAVERSREQVAELQNTIRMREHDIEKLTAAATEGDADAAAQIVGAQVEELRAQNVKLEGDLAQALLRTAEMVEAPTKDRSDGALEDLRTENDRLAEELAKARDELETQKIELAAAQLAGRDDYEAERRENAIVRERINDLAARVTAMTAEIEGTASPIDRILEETPEPPAFPPEAYDTRDGRPPKSLADRIRALKRLGEDS